MKNSQYVNQLNVSANDLVRLQFMEVSNGGENIEVIVLSMLPDAAEVFAKVIIQTVEQHKNNIEVQKKVLNSDKDLN
jgi:hypothetical protein